MKDELRGGLNLEGSCHLPDLGMEWKGISGCGTSRLLVEILFFELNVQQVPWLKGIFSEVSMTSFFPQY